MNQEPLSNTQANTNANPTPNTQNTSVTKKEEDDTPLNIGAIIAVIGFLIAVSGGALAIFEGLGFARYPIWVWVLVLIARFVFMGHWAICLIVGIILLGVGMLINFFIEKKQKKH